MYALALAKRRKMRLSRPIRKNYGYVAVHNFRRTQYLNQALIIPTGSGYTFNSFAFNFNAMPDFTNFTSLYDMYKINKIRFTLIPRTTETTQATSTWDNQVSSVIDYDDVTVPTTLDQLLQYPNMKMTRGTKIHSRTWVPRIRMLTDLSGAHEVKRAGWLDAANTGVPHYGIKLAIAQSSISQIYDIRVDFFISCKGTH